MTIMRLEVSALRDTGSPTSGDAAGMVRSFPGTTTRGTLGGFRSPRGGMQNANDLGRQQR